MSESKFHDHFSKHANQYREFRPTYPDALFSYLAGLVKEHEIAWDCATGNGQAAVSLAHYFDTVIATDASQMQIDNAAKQQNIEYRVAKAEQSGISDLSVDLITVAQALHWFDLDAFYSEAKRVLKPNGVLAVWCYSLLTTTNPELNNLIHTFYTEIIESYWPKERDYIDKNYKTIPFPFHKIQTPSFKMKFTWSIKRLLAYINTWSAVQRYQQQHSINPVESWLIANIQKCQIDIESNIHIAMPLTLMAGY